MARLDFHVSLRMTGGQAKVELLVWHDVSQSSASSSLLIADD